MRLLHLAANRWWTGSADPVLRLVLGLRARGHRVLLGVTPGDRFEAKAREAGVELVPGLRLDTGLAARRTIADVRRLRTLRVAASLELVHTNHSHDHWLGWLTARSPGGPALPLVRTFHTGRAVKTGPLSRWLYRRTGAVFAASPGVERRCREAGIPAERLHRIPGVADLARFAAPADPALVRDEFKLGDAPVIACVARLAPNRGHEGLLAGFRRLRDRLPRARLLLVGKGETRPRLEHLVSELDLTDRVIFTGYRDADLPAVLAAADCVVLMAAGSDESCRAALEAMAAGRPVVAGRAGALPETVVHGETGWLLDGTDPAEVADALATVLADRERARAMGAAGRRRAETVYHPDRAAAVVDAVYRTIAGARRPDPPESAS